MTRQEQLASDLDLILSKRQHLGGDLWTTPDLRIGTGSPFSARDVAIILSELGLAHDDPLIQELSSMLFTTWRADGRFRISPTGTIYPCHTITILRVLCYMGWAGDERIQKTFDHLLSIQHEDGGWRCNKTKPGKSDLTDASNPGVTLEALDAFRHTATFSQEKRLENAVESLLAHWEIKIPLGPCHFGIGSRFMQTEFPFLRYNLFYYCYVLSFYEIARQDPRYLEALQALDNKVAGGNMIAENPNRRLAKLSICQKGMASKEATKRYNEIKTRLKQVNHGS